MYFKKWLRTKDDRVGYCKAHKPPNLSSIKNKLFGILLRFVQWSLNKFNLFIWYMICENANRNYSHGTCLRVKNSSRNWGSNRKLVLAYFYIADGVFMCNIYGKRRSAKTKIFLCVFKVWRVCIFFLRSLNE